MMDSGYGNSGYSNSGYGNSGYSGSSPSYYGSSPYAASPYYSSGYQRPVTNNYYTTYQPQPQVVTRYVPVPTAAPAQIQRNPSRWEGRRNRDTNTTTPTNNQQPANNQQTNRRRDRDSDNDGIPDRQERRAGRNASP
jgi:hypothetical protein